MSKPKIAPCGSWKSPIEAKQIAEGSTGLFEVRFDGDRLYWVEMRPTEGGRCVVVRRDADGTPWDMTPEGFNARTRVHEYGGGAYLPDREGVWFVNFADQRLYRAEAGKVEAITPECDVRYADLVSDRRCGRLIAVTEDHRGGGESVNAIAAIDLATGAVSSLVSGNDFYSSPRLSPDGTRLAWLTWNHPDMPWDAAELWVAPVNEDGSLAEAERVAGGPDESIAQPEWSPDGTLYFVSDRTDWWNIHRLREGKVEPVMRLDAEFAMPAWVFRTSAYHFDGPDRIICTFARNGLWRLATVDVKTLALTPIETEFNTIRYLRVSGGKVAFIGGSATKPSAAVLMKLATGATTELRRSSDLAIDPGYLSEGEAVEFPTEGGTGAHGIFYPSRNKDFAAPEGERPPLVVMVHGGPTSAAAASLSLKVQYYTSRGVAVLDVNYGGSTGYGRKYRERLCGKWGIVDVDDCCNGARFLAKQGRVDGRRMAITGGSAGGYTTLSCLAFRDVFAVGASHYGISDCEALAKETHKFESRYLDGLIAPYPEGRAVYHERSALYHLDGFNCPVAFFQGLEDKIVPPNQAQMMVDALREKGIPVAHVTFEGEQHGFRKSESIIRALEGELYFFSRVFAFEPADEIEPLQIDNL